LQKNFTVFYGILTVYLHFPEMLKEKINKLLNLKNYYKHNIINILISNSKNVNFLKIFSNFFWSVHCPKYSHFVTQLLNLNTKSSESWSHFQVSCLDLIAKQVYNHEEVSHTLQILSSPSKKDERSNIVVILSVTWDRTSTNISKTW